MDLERRTRRLAAFLDGTLALAVLALGLFRDAGRINPAPGQVTAGYWLDLPPGVLVAAHVLGATALLWRRRRTEVVAIALTGLAVLTPVVAAIVMPYSVARYLPGIPRSVPLCVLLLAAVLTGAGLWDEVIHWGNGPGDPLTPILLMAGLTAAGLYLGARTDLLQQLRERAEAAERESRLRAAQERLQDRAALALVLHDVAAHWVTLMTMQAGALSVQATDPEIQRESEELRVKGERALTELHRLIRVLSSGAEEVELPTGQASPADSLQRLVAECTPGLAAEFTETGQARDAPAEVIGLLRRVLVETLLNAVKHAPGGRVEVRVTWHAEQVEAEVTSWAQPTPGRMPTPGVGSRVGLAALARRCAQAGGRLTAGPRGHGPFHVVALLPYRGPA